MVLGGSKRRQASPIVGPSQQFHRVYPSWKKTGRDCESRPNAPPTWGRFDMNNVTQPTNQIKKDFWRQGQGFRLYSKSSRRLYLGLILDDDEEDKNGQRG